MHRSFYNSQFVTLFFSFFLVHSTLAAKESKWQESLRWAEVSVLRHSEITQLKLAVESSQRPLPQFGKFTKAKTFEDFENERNKIFKKIGIQSFVNETKDLKTSKTEIRYTGAGHYLDFSNRKVYYKEVLLFRPQISHRLLFTSMNKEDLENPEVAKATQKALNE